MGKIKIKLVKSPIDHPNKQRKTLEALGLRKLNTEKEVEATPQVEGMIRSVSHLIEVEKTD